MCVWIHGSCWRPYDQMAVFTLSTLFSSFPADSWQELLLLLSASLFVLLSVVIFARVLHFLPKVFFGGPLFFVRLMMLFSEIIGVIITLHRYLMNIKSGRWKSHCGLLLVVSVVFTTVLDHLIWILGFSFNPANLDFKSDTPRVSAVL